MVFEYLNYRDYLKAFYTYRKTASRSFSYRSFARQIGVPGHGHIKMVMEGQRNLSPKMARKIGLACDLDRNGTAYFVTLVRWNQSTDLYERQSLWRELVALRSDRTSHEISDEESFLLADWWNVAVFETLRLEDFSDDPAWIAQRLGNQISPERVLDILNGLLEAGLIERTPEGLRESKQTLVKGGDAPNAVIQLFHHQAASAGIRALETTPVPLREYMATTVTIRRDQLADIKSDIRRFQQRLLQAAESIRGGEEVYQLNIQFFPITEKG